jgi:hypothetical protein
MFLCVLGGAGCGDDDGGTDIDAGLDADIDSDVGDDADVDAEVDGDIDAEVAMGCTGESPAEPQDIGGCCNGDYDCTQAASFCVGGWCSNPSCEQDADCVPISSGAFPADTEFRCNSNEMGFASFCAPGSLQPCGADGDAPCPSGETCVLGWDSTAVDPGAPGLRGICLTNMAGEGLIATGEQCDSHADAFFYQCEAPGYVLSSCLGRRCTAACDVDNPQDTCPAGLECVGPVALDTGSADILLASGLCAGQRCGYLEFTDTPEDDVRLPGLDSECPSGEVCTPFFVTGVNGDTLEMRCIPEVAAYGGAGDVCEHAEKFQQHCSNDLCLQAAAEWDSNGIPCLEDEDCGPQEVCASSPSPFQSDRCSAKPDAGFCSVMCRSDADCPNMSGGPSYCVDIGAGEMPNGLSSYFTVCYPETELFEETPTPCEKESDCNISLGEGCVRLSSYSDLKVCTAVVSADTAGADCTTDPNVCTADEACVDDGTGTSYCTPIAQVGESCDSADATCASGLCLDTDLGVETENGDPTNTFCVAPCTLTTDCGPNQVCENILWAENDPAVETDDITGGLCRPMTVLTGTGCSVAGDCASGQSCDSATGRCFTSGVPWGSACAADADCDQNGLCDTDVVNGLCYKPGCDPAAGNADCGGGDSTCSDNSAVGVCLESCTVDTDCSRNATDGFICNNGACEAP